MLTTTIVLGTGAATSKSGASDKPNSGWDKNQNWIVTVVGFNKGQDTTLIPKGFEPLHSTRSDAAGLGIVCRKRS